VLNPATREHIAHLPVGSASDVDDAVATAALSQPGWAADPAAREDTLLRVAHVMADNRDELAHLESLDTGKSVSNATAEIEGAAQIVRYYAGYATKLYGEHVPYADRGTVCYTVREPFGVVGAITPWNYPLLIAAGKVAAALAAGNAVVLKPAPETPLSSCAFGFVAHQAGLPSGLLNVVVGDGETGQHLVDHFQVGKVSFTGSTSTGSRILERLSRRRRPSVMELGGKSANVVLDDAPLERHIDDIILGAIYNAGQECCAGSRVFIQEGIKDEFLDLLADRLPRIRVGPPSDPASQIGPLISQRQYDRVHGFVERALRDGARIAAQASAPNGGFFYPPTALVDVKPDMEICTEEVFGPVFTVDFFVDDAEALRLSNSVNYGLAAGVWTSDIGRALTFADGFEAGQVWVNSYLAGDVAAPFGGNKDSGFGRELGSAGVAEFSQTKTVYLRG
jgi:acyl-CoA reductase-like NAD-dependent aldehyde dehydrogenase